MGRVVYSPYRETQIRLGPTELLNPHPSWARLLSSPVLPQGMLKSVSKPTWGSSLQRTEGVTLNSAGPNWALGDEPADGSF